MAIHEFEDPIAVITPCGRGFALFVDTSPHQNWWTVAISETCALITYPQNKIKIHRSYTHGRGITDEMMKELTK